MSDCRPDIKVSLLLTGNEVLLGDIVDSNSAFMARELAGIGVNIREKVVVGDDLSEIVRAMDRMSAENDIVIMNGGLGSTVDDLTTEAVAEITGEALMENAQAMENIRIRYGERFTASDSSYYQQIRKQAMLPGRASVIPNPVGIAAGFKLRINRAFFYFTPGVPREMKVMLKESILPDIVEAYHLERRSLTSRFRIIGIGESYVQQAISKKIPQNDWQGVRLGFRAGSPFVEVKLTTDSDEFYGKLQEIEQALKTLFSHYIFSADQTMAETVVMLLRERGKCLSAVEGCTGGLLCSSLSSVPGGSEVLKGGIVSDAGPAAENLIPEEKGDQASTGNLAPAVTERILAGMPADLSADYYLFTKATKQGTTTLMWGTSSKLFYRHLKIRRDPDVYRHLVCETGLDLLRRYILDLPFDSAYYYDDISRQQLVSRQSSD